MRSSAQLDRTETVRIPRAKKGKADGVRFKRSGYVAAAARPKTAQAVFKVISHARGHRVRILMNYVARSESEQPLAMEDEMGLKVQGLEGVEAVYQEWSQDFERAAPGQKRPPRHVTHTTFSGDCAQTPENALAVQNAVRELMAEQLGRDGYRYLMVLHTDTENPHIHVLIDNYNRDLSKPKLILNPPELLAMRQQFAQKLRERGIEQQATRRLDRPAILAAVAAMEAQGPWYVRALQTTVDKQATITQEPTPFDALAKRRTMARALAKLHQDVKATTLPFTKERRERLAQLRQVGQKLIDPAAPDYKRLVADLVLKFDKDRERVKDHIRALSDPANPVKDIKRRRQREQSIEKILDRNIEAVRAARLDLERSPGWGKSVEHHKLAQQLKDYERELKRIRLLHSFGFEKQAAPGTAAEVAAARTIEAVTASVTRTADKLQALGPWFEPTPRIETGEATPAMLKLAGRLAEKNGVPVAATDRATVRAYLEKHSPKREGQAKAVSFDAFAKRKSLTTIAAYMAGRLDRAGVDPSAPIALRVAALCAAQVEAPAPDISRLVGALQDRLQDVRARADFEARRATHRSTDPAERVQILATLKKDLSARVAGLKLARREVAEAPGLADRERLALVARLKRMERIVVQAGQLTDKPRELAAKFAELDKLNTTAPAKIPPARETPTLTTRSDDHAISSGPDVYAGPSGYGLRDTPAHPFSEPELYAGPHGQGQAPVTLDGLRTLSGLDLDGRDRGRSTVLLPDHAPTGLDGERTQGADQLRRPDNGLGAGEGRQGESRGEGQRIEPMAAPGDRLNQEQFAVLLDRVHTRLVEAGPWDDPTPFRSGHREFFEGDSGKARAPAMDAFAKQRNMLQEIDRLKPAIDAAHINFTPGMRRQLAAIRELRYDIEHAPAKDIAEVVGRLAQKVTDDQMRILAQDDKPAATATEALQRRRQTTRTADRNLQSVEAARQQVKKQPGLEPAQRNALADRLKVMAKAMAIYSGKSRGM